MADDMDYEALGRYTEAKDLARAECKELKMKLQDLADDLARAISSADGTTGRTLPKIDPGVLQTKLTAVMNTYRQLVGACSEANIQASKCGKPKFE